MNEKFTVELPEFPEEVNSVKAMIRGEIDTAEPLDYYYTQEQMRAFAAEAVANAISNWQNEMGEPQAWIRHCSDGCIEGPIAHHQCEQVRRDSGVWMPLYPMPLSIRSEP
ncbi:hypothetical protein FHR47_002277 [Xanthomonas arboricola]|uniref:hypothetical protein n=1 Tax=Xanthomonas cannabis TaxID=1885674 RepID=UPI00161F95A2|nr:hypothetical protein [Xanthomonas cannabis]MBB3802029.1 hypothetical protein [Xanthomonas cannabis]